MVRNIYKCGSGAIEINIVIWVFFIVFLLSGNVHSGSGTINDDIQYSGFEINGEDSLYAAGDLTYYVEEDKRFNATVFFCNIFDKVMAKANVRVTLKENDDSVSFNVPIHIGNEFDPLEVKSTHHIQWEINRIEKIECCVNHGGIAGCDDNSGNIECLDGTISKKCTCEEYDISE